MLVKEAPGVHPYNSGQPYMWLSQGKCEVTLRDTGENATCAKPQQNKTIHTILLVLCYFPTFSLSLSLSTELLGRPYIRRENICGIVKEHWKTCIPVQHAYHKDRDMTNKPTV